MPIPTATPTRPPQPPDSANEDLPELAEAFAREARRGVRLAALGRAACFAVLWLSFADNARWRADNVLLQYRTALVGVAILLGVIQVVIVASRRRPVAWSYPFVVADFALATALVFGWQPWFLHDYPQFLAVRYQDILFFVLMLSLTVLPLSGRLPLAAAIVALVAWCSGLTFSFLTTPGAITSDQVAPTLAGPSLLREISRPNVLNTDYVALQAAALVALGLLLAQGVVRARGTVAAGVRAAAERDRLARFFPPAVLERLGRGADSAAEVMTVTVLFTDFDRRREADATLSNLDAHYAACERILFRYGGVVDRFVGDAVMASFGVTGQDRAGAPDAAFRCALELGAELARLPLGCAGVGLANGPAVIGEVGSDRHRSFGVVGATTNLASRMLTEATRCGLRLVAPEALAAQMSPALREGLVELGPMPIRGLQAPTRLLCLPW